MHDETYETDSGWTALIGNIVVSALRRLPVLMLKNLSAKNLQASKQSAPPVYSGK